MDIYTKNDIQLKIDEAAEKIKQEQKYLPELHKMENNGGKTGYYDLPKPRSIDIRNILQDYNLGKLDISEAITLIYETFPQTLNDLIEWKDMKPWQHEVFKANYALRERAEKNPDKGSSIIREINKILYYANRGLELELKKGE